MAAVRKLGCIPMVEQEMMARTLGVKSDREKVLEAYKIAVEEKYRFFSFGDASMFI